MSEPLGVPIMVEAIVLREWVPVKLELTIRDRISAEKLYRAITREPEFLSLRDALHYLLTEVADDRQRARET